MGLLRVTLVRPGRRTARHLLRAVALDLSVLLRRARREMKIFLICEFKYLPIHPARDAEPSDVTDCQM